MANTTNTKPRLERDQEMQDGKEEIIKGITHSPSVSHSFMNADVSVDVDSPTSRAEGGIYADIGRGKTALIFLNGKGINKNLVEVNPIRVSLHDGKVSYVSEAVERNIERWEKETGNSAPLKKAEEIMGKDYFSFIKGKEREEAKKIMELVRKGAVVYHIVDVSDTSLLQCKSKSHRKVITLFFRDGDDMVVLSINLTLALEKSRKMPRASRVKKGILSKEMFSEKEGCFNIFLDMVVADFRDFLLKKEGVSNSKLKHGPVIGAELREEVDPEHQKDMLSNLQIEQIEYSRYLGLGGGKAGEEAGLSIKRRGLDFSVSHKVVSRISDYSEDNGRKRRARLALKQRTLSKRRVEGGFAHILQKEEKRALERSDMGVVGQKAFGLEGSLNSLGLYVGAEKSRDEICATMENLQKHPRIHEGALILSLYFEEGRNTANTVDTAKEMGEHHHGNKLCISIANRNEGGKGGQPISMKSKPRGNDRHKGQEDEDVCVSLRPFTLRSYLIKKGVM